MLNILLGDTFFATGVCLFGVILSVLAWHLLLTRQAPLIFLFLIEYFYLRLAPSACSKRLPRILFTHVEIEPSLTFIPSLSEKQAWLIPSLSEEQACLMRAWMTGLILAIFGLWLATI